MQGSVFYAGLAILGLIGFGLVMRARGGLRNQDPSNRPIVLLRETTAEEKKKPLLYHAYLSDAGRAILVAANDNSAGVGWSGIMVRMSGVQRCFSTDDWIYSRWPCMDASQAQLRNR
ncbi:hypothetical protein FB45DRAFT_920009 [Roridomyces roridus]|uniref:Uncharacterized protein n=1 Tax=Roridomyces roridus TaxID=1738132 RepID=A0AAD7BSC5_9AGAR|nr:hypothetical protein FB45DRAFT_920009 [Roridomyces roridus]